MERGFKSHCCDLFCIYRSFLNTKTVVGNKGTNFTTASYCHHFGPREVIGHVTVRPAVGSFQQMTLDTNPLSRTVSEILSLKYFGGHNHGHLGSRDVIGHVTTRLAVGGFL